MNWIKFFEDSIGAIHQKLSYIVTQASGCREGWLQGEMVIAGKEYNLWANECVPGKRGRVDLLCGDPPTMVAEIKVVGSHYAPMMQGAIEADLERLLQFNAEGAERYMILIIPKSEKRPPLGEYLISGNFSDKCRQFEHGEFQVRIWRI
jgi:hypothetical protein